MASLFRGYLGVVVGVVVLVAMGNNGGGAWRCGAAKVMHHVVGGDQGWDACTDVAAWSIDKVFRVGDNIWFAYSAAHESIVELQSNEEFESCDLSNPIRMYTSGLDKVNLLGEGSRYFVSSRPENCQNGLKLLVETVQQAEEGSEPAKLVATNQQIIARQVIAAAPKPSSSAGIKARPLVPIGLAIGLAIWI